MHKNTLPTAIAFLMAPLLSAPVWASETEYLVVNAIEDTHIDSVRPDTNYGDKPWNHVSSTEKTLLKFTLPYLANRKVVSARLNVGLYKQSTADQQVHLIADDQWDEKQVTWNTRPAIEHDSIGVLSNSSATSPADRRYDIELSTSVLERLSGTQDETISLQVSALTSGGIFVVSQDHRHMVAQLKLNTVPLEQTVRVPVHADNYIDERYPDYNFANHPVLKVDASPLEKSYLSFDLAEFARDNIVAATLNMKVTNASSATQQLHLITNPDTAIHAITLDNRPSVMEPAIATLNGGQKGEWISIDVSDVVQQHRGGSLALAMQSGGQDGIDFIASGHADEPYLNITHVDARTISNDMLLGINIAEPSWYSTEWPFIDLMKTSMAIWLTSCDRWGADSDPGCKQFPTGDNTKEQHKLDLDENGWVKSLPQPGQYEQDGTVFTRVSTKIPTSLNPENPGGRYVVRYDGQGTMTYADPARKIEAESTPGRDVIDIRYRDGISAKHHKYFILTVQETDPNQAGDYLRNIRVYPPGGVCANEPAVFCDTDATMNACSDQQCLTLEAAAEQQGNQFDPRFLANIQEYNTLRFMGFQDTNGARNTRTWDERARPEMRTYQRDLHDRGAIEVMTAMGNTVDANIWVNMPAKADDDYITRTAQKALETLSPDRKVYVEYSNEAWNFGFKMTYWMQEQAKALWPDVTDQSAYFKGLNWYGMRSAQTCQLWKQAWGDEADRIHCVIGTQAWPAMMRLSVECPIWKARNGGTACHEMGIDTLAVAPYFGHYLGNGANAELVASWANDPDGGLDRLFNELLYGGEIPGEEEGGALIQARRKMLAAKAYADSHGLNLVAYEGGQHLAATQSAANNPTVVKLLADANRDPRMKEVYLRYLDYWSEINGGLFNHWISTGPYSRWGNWGSKEYRDQKDAPKHEALMQYIEWIPDNKQY